MSTFKQKMVILMVAIFCLSVGSVQAQSLKAKATTTVLDTIFGIGSEVTQRFVFQNPGTDAITVSFVSSSCDCATPVWSKASIAAADTSSIVVKFEPKDLGPFEKSFTAYDDLRRPIGKFSITGFVAPARSTLTYSFTYNQNQIPLQRLRQLLQHQPSLQEVDILASASRQITKSFSDNKALAISRAQQAKAAITKALVELGRSTSPRFTIRTKIGGPAADPKADPAVYSPYQFVTITVR
jgi:hypothetical protein